jgi:hypothetical protein
VNFVRVMAVAAVCLFPLILSCRHNTQPASAYPRWILNETAIETTDPGHFAPVRGCPQVRWHYSDSGDSHLTTCYNGTNVVRAYDHFEQPVTIYYVVECDGYFPSNVQSASFDPANATVAPGRGGPEVLFNETITLVHE